MGESVNGGVFYADAAAAPSDIIALLGYSYTGSQIAAQLVKLSGIMSLTIPLPFVQMVEILAGAGIIILVLAVAYSAVAVGVNNQLVLWYNRNYDSMVKAKEISIRVAIEEKNGAKFWYAYPANWFGLGGIQIGIPMKTVQEAQKVVLANTPYNNVFTLTRMLAENLARSCGTPVGPKCHVVSSDNVPQPLNLWHYHVGYPNNRRGLTHIFYPSPY